MLICTLEYARDIPLGRKGTRAYDPGTYAYVGSAMGGGIRQRVSRHLSPKERYHWHIDWFLDYAHIDDIATKECAKGVECRTARALVEKGVVVRGFGSSDCRCPGHLVRIGWGTALGLLGQLGYSLLSTV